jgi:chromosome segregation ATPase
MQASLRLFPFVWLVALASCSSTGCDPSRAGFLEGISCTSGGYQQREAFLNQGVAQAQANMLEERAQAASAAQTAAAAQARLSARRQELTRLDARLAELRRQLQVTAARGATNQEELHRASARIAELSQMQATARTDPTEANLRAIQDRQQQVAKLLEELD